MKKEYWAIYIGNDKLPSALFDKQVWEKDGLIVWMKDIPDSRIDEFVINKK